MFVESVSFAIDEITPYLLSGRMNFHSWSSTGMLLLATGRRSPQEPYPHVPRL